jgi:hypothetical protein
LTVAALRLESRFQRMSFLRLAAASRDDPAFGLRPFRPGVERSPAAQAVGLTAQNFLTLNGVK